MTSELHLASENVQAYPRPPALQAVPHRLQVWLGGVLVADTRRGLRILETHHAPSYYFPPDDVSAELIAAGGSSFCEWKGTASYWDVRAGETLAQQAAWSYERPVAQYAALSGFVSFYPGSMERCEVGGVAVQPQPGDFYGGWVTSNLTGQIKGAPGTRHW